MTFQFADVGNSGFKLLSLCFSQFELKFHVWEAASDTPVLRFESRRKRERKQKSTRASTSRQAVLLVPSALKSELSAAVVRALDSSTRTEKSYKNNISLFTILFLSNNFSAFSCIVLMFCVCFLFLCRYLGNIALLYSPLDLPPAAVAGDDGMAILTGKGRCRIGNS